MTRNQILYQQNVETARSHQVSEQLQRDQNTETKRANLARETETHRANVANETETNRANLARETETNRANLAREEETNRSNLANELLKAQANSIQASGNRLNYAASMANVAEQQRSHLAAEIEANRHNLATEANTVRGQDVTSETSKYTADTSANASKYGSDSRYAATVYSADSNADASKYASDSRIAQQELQNANNIVLEQMRQDGYNERQLKQIASDAVKVLHDDVVKLIESGAAKKTIQDLMTNYYLNQLRKENK